MKQGKFKILFAVLLVVIAACGGGGGNTGGGGTSAANTIAGLVTDIGTGARLSGVAVGVVGGSQSTTTDSKGEFLLGSLPAGNIKLTLSKSGYAPGYATADSTTSARTALVALKKEGTQQSYNPTQARTLFTRTEAGPYAVIFTPNSLDTTDTNLKVVVTPLDPTKEDLALPGDLVASGGTPLAAVTFAEFSILDSVGKRINLKAGSSAIVELPIPAELRSQYPIGSKIHCYAYNPATGKWEDFVEGTVELSSVDGNTPVLKASIRHFSWYGGAPAVQDQTCTYVKVVSKLTGKPLEGAVVTARPGLRAVTDKNGDAAITTQRGKNVSFFASKTYTDTYVDKNGNLIPQKGSKVIEIGRVEEDDLTALVPGPCKGDAQAAKVWGMAVGEAGNPVVINTGQISDFTYNAFAVLTGPSLAVTLERGFPNEEGDLDNPEPASGAKISVRGSNGQTITLSEVAAGTGQYFAQGFSAQAGQQYTLELDTDGNGTIDGSGSAYALGTVALTAPTNGASLPRATATAVWTDSASNSTGYAPIYFLSIIGQGAAASYIGSDRSFLIKDAQGQALPAGSYTASLNAFSGGFSGAGSNFNISDNITGPGVRGIFSSFGSPITVSFTLTGP